LPGPVIIGGGPAGAAAAITLARAGQAPTLIERTAGATDKVCGDFLSAETVEMLKRLGIDLSAAPSITTLRLVHRNHTATTRLPFTALGLTRRALDDALLRQARASGATLVRGHRVGAVTDEAGRLRLDCSSLGSIIADTVFVATGKSMLRGAGPRGHGSGMVGLKMYYWLAPVQQTALRHHIELILFAGGYAGLQLVEADLAVLCVLISTARMRSLGGRWENLLDALATECPPLGSRLAGAQASLARPLAVAGLPYGYLYVPDERRDPPGLFRLGDQAAVIGSLSGDGVAVALASGSFAARSWLAGDHSVHYHQRLAAGLSRPLRVASTLHRLCLAPRSQPWLTAACRFWPGVMRHAASWTRVGCLT
jgi:flavin-dependent dehydrogenase